MIRCHPLASRFSPLSCLLLLGACLHRPSSAPAASRCAQIDRENREALEKLAHIQKVPTPELDSALREALRCVEAPREAWALALGELTTDDEGVWGRWSVVHIDAMGKRLSVAPNPIVSLLGRPQDPVTEDRNLEWSRYTHTVLAAPVLFDFDGDGSSEAVVVIQMDDVEITNHVSRGRVWTARGDALSVYKPARDIIVDGARDIDGDGRLDLMTHERYTDQAYINCGSGDGYSVLGPLLLMHSLADGTFSRDDATAVFFAKRECSELPRPVIAHDDSYRDKDMAMAMVDMRRSAKNIACARMRGADKESLLSEIDTQCHPLPEGSCVTCDNKELLQRWATLDPPLRIR